MERPQCTGRPGSGRRRCPGNLESRGGDSSPRKDLTEERKRGLVRLPKRTRQKPEPALAAEKLRMRVERQRQERPCSACGVLGHMIRRAA
ncbi:hypothetical protein P7K49_002529 [Saguinus oedipus]|uniref:Uncharacterized protein n=1 Tax=Saguinus oedipus TaxID=9490 RepID=A0ABQ9WHK6_SAGOE|nr:hypothetical protein P7K49_002529 [Saguinus oedipus]